MKRGGRYDTSRLTEAQFEPGSRCRVLKNKLGIKGKRIMDELEREEQVRAMEELPDMYESNHQFMAADICNMHRV